MYDGKNVPFFIRSPILYTYTCLYDFFLICHVLFFCMCITCCSSDYFFVVLFDIFYYSYMQSLCILCTCGLWYPVSYNQVYTYHNVGNRAKLCFHMVWNRLLLGESIKYKHWNTKASSARQTQEASHREYFVFLTFVWLFWFLVK